MSRRWHSMDDAAVGIQPDLTPDHPLVIERNGQGGDPERRHGQHTYQNTVLRFWANHVFCFWNHSHGFDQLNW